MKLYVPVEDGDVREDILDADDGGGGERWRGGKRRKQRGAWGGVAVNNCPTIPIFLTIILLPIID